VTQELKLLFLISIRIGLWYIETRASGGTEHSKLNWFLNKSFLFDTFFYFAKVMKLKVFAVASVDQKKGSQYISIFLKKTSFVGKLKMNKTRKLENDDPPEKGSYSWIKVKIFLTRKGCKICERLITLQFIYIHWNLFHWSLIFLSNKM